MTGGGPRSCRRPSISLISSLSHLGNIVSKSVGKALFAPCHGYDGGDAGVNLSSNLRRTPALEGAELGECARHLARIAEYSAEILTCHQSEHLAWWAEQIQSENERKHVEGFDWAIWEDWADLDQLEGRRGRFQRRLHLSLERRLCTRLLHCFARGPDTAIPVVL